MELLLEFIIIPSLIREVGNAAAAELAGARHRERGSAKEALGTCLTQATRGGDAYCNGGDAGLTFEKAGIVLAGHAFCLTRHLGMG